MSISQDKFNFRLNFFNQGWFSIIISWEYCSINLGQIKINLKSNLTPNINNCKLKWQLDQRTRLINWYQSAVSCQKYFGNGKLTVWLFYQALYSLKLLPSEQVCISQKSLMSIHCKKAKQNCGGHLYTTRNHTDSFFAWKLTSFL